jgi:hypothetical protein
LTTDSRADREQADAGDTGKSSPGRVDPKKVYQWRGKCASYQKEIRNLKAQQAKMKWEMERDRKKIATDDKREVTDDLREWRQQWVKELQECVRTRETAQTAALLEEDKVTAEFKRERRKVLADEEHKRVQDELQEDTAWSLWEENRLQELDASQHLHLKDERELVQEERKIRSDAEARAREEEEYTREQERIREMNYSIKLADDEAKALEASLSLTRSAFERHELAKEARSASPAMHHPESPAALLSTAPENEPLTFTY